MAHADSAGEVCASGGEPGVTAGREKQDQQQRYFDSADYNMARARAHVTTPREFPVVPQNDTGEAIPTVESLPPRNAAIEQSKLATLTLF
ncbi:hypothetical protein HPB47_008628 [Ixodes persulcatus]|uniref:Uncharacterized protein n=1 Tax=Ixodes persulcatus TaxID=34615 RepID=A0AC60P480_IXOPE|nr:hypothetical protein HPB47_008628 [Ixodes persulcatus]